jgi:hypothetical protein
MSTSAPPAPWSSGQNVTIDNPKGRVDVLADNPVDTILISGTGITYRGSSPLDEKGAERHLSELKPSATVDAGGNIAIGSPAAGNDEYDLVVSLPVKFDGILQASTHNGKIAYKGTPLSAGNRVHSDRGAARVTLNAGTNAKVVATAIGGTVTLQGSFAMTTTSPNGQMATAIAGAGTASIDVSTDSGDVTVELE